MADNTTPPADDVREAIIDAINGCIPDDIPGYRQRYTDKAADAIVTAFELRPRASITPAPEGWANDVREALADALSRAFGYGPLSRWGSNSYTQRLLQRADTILAAFEVRSRGTVTDAEVEAAWRSILETASDVTTRGDVRLALEAAQEARRNA